MIKQLLNSAIAKYRDLSVARRSIICLCLRHQYLTSACDDDVEDFAGEALVEWDDLKSQIYAR